MYTLTQRQLVTSLSVLLKRNQPTVWLLLLLMTSLLGPRPASADTPDWQALLAGQIIVESQGHPEGFPGVRASFTVAATLQRIWAVLLDYPNFPKIFHNVKTLRVLSEDKQGAKLAYQVDGILSTYSYVLSRRYDEPERRLTWTRLSGDLKHVEGSWEIRDTPRPELRLLIYELYVDLGSFIPQSMVRSEVMRQTHEMGERLRAWIEGRPLPSPGQEVKPERKEATQ